MYPALTVWVLTLSLLSARCEYLFRASPGGDGIKPAGLWGGAISWETTGQSENLFLAGVGELNVSNSIISGFGITSMSYDPYEQEVLFEVEDPSMVVRGPLCGQGSSHPQYRIMFQDTELVDYQNPYLIDSGCSFKCGWNAFTIHGSKIYFVLSAVFGPHPASLERKIQIRVLEGCEDLIDSRATSFPIMDCSRWISTLHTDTYKWPNAKPSVWVASSMNIVQTSRNGPVQFYVQLFNKTSSGVNMTLVQSLVAGSQTETRTLHTVAVPSEYGGNWRIRGLGQIAYRAGTLCWTAAETLLCGQVTDAWLHDVSQVLESGAAHAAGVCAGDLEPLPMGRVLTGVAVAHLTSPLAVYFGCYSQLAKVGGVGLVTVTWTGTSVQRSVLPITSARTKVYGGSLQLVDSLSYTCIPASSTMRPSYPTTPGNEPTSGRLTTSRDSTTTITPTEDKPSNKGIAMQTAYLLIYWLFPMMLIF